MPIKKNVYLAGPIRLVNDDYNSYDVEWRKEITEKYRNNELVRFYNPVNVNFIKYCKDNKISNILDHKSLNYIYINDMRMIEYSDICIANIIPLYRDNYPCFGTIAEIGMFIYKKKPVIILCEKNVKDSLQTNPIYLNCKLCTSLDEIYMFLDDILKEIEEQVKCECNTEEIFNKLTEFQDPFLQNKYSVDLYDDDMIIIHNTKLNIQTVYKALYRRKV